MNRLTILKLTLLAVGIAVFGWGVYVQDREIRWYGIAFLAAGFLMRILTRRRDEDADVEA